MMKSLVAIFMVMTSVLQSVQVLLAEDSKTWNITHGVAARVPAISGQQDYNVLDEQDNCPDDPNKTEPGICGCNLEDVDSDADGAPDCTDVCPFDVRKIEAGECGCGIPDLDADGDFLSDCLSDPEVTPPADAAPTTLEEGIALAVKAKRLIKLFKKKTTRSVVAAIRASLERAQQAFSVSLAADTFSEAQEKRIQALVTKLKRLQRGKTRGTKWKRKKKAGLKAGSRVINVLS